MLPTLEQAIKDDGIAFDEIISVDNGGIHYRGVTAGDFLHSPLGCGILEKHVFTLERGHYAVDIMTRYPEE